MFKTGFNFGRLTAAFMRRNDGAVTVDWVVLTAAMVVLVTGVFLTINQSVLENAAGGIAENVTEAGTR